MRIISFFQKPVTPVSGIILLVVILLTLGLFSIKFNPLVTEKLSLDVQEEQTLSRIFIDKYPKREMYEVMLISPDGNTYLKTVLSIKDLKVLKSQIDKFFELEAKR